jgi:hypothetical protein
VLLPLLYVLVGVETDRCWVELPVFNELSERVLVLVPVGRVYVLVLLYDGLEAFSG